MFEKAVKTTYFLGIQRELQLLSKKIPVRVFWRHLTNIHFLITGH